MAKSIAMTVPLEITTSELMDIAARLVDNVYREYGNTVCDCAGLVRKELVRDVMACGAFRKEVIRQIQMNGLDAVNNPYDYFDYDSIEQLPGGRRLISCLDTMQSIIEDAECNTIDMSDVIAAQSLLQKAGYTVSR